MVPFSGLQSLSLQNLLAHFYCLMSHLSTYLPFDLLEYLRSRVIGLKLGVGVNQIIGEKILKYS